MASHVSKEHRATVSASIGTDWENVQNIYDTSTTTYANRYADSTSAIHINGFDFSDIPEKAEITAIEIYTRAYASTKNGYLDVYIYTDEGPTAVKIQPVLDGASLEAQYVSQSYTADKIIEALENNGVCNGDIRQLLNTFRVRIVGGSVSSILSTTIRIYDNYILVHYTLPEYKITTKVSPTEGGTVTGGGTYEVGKKVTIKATPNTGYRFVKWNNGNTNATRTITVSKNATYTAYFEKEEASEIYCGTKKVVAVYCGTKKMSAYCGTKRIL